jgi:hypothetical protein
MRDNNKTNEKSPSLEGRRPINDYEEILNQNKLLIHPLNNPIKNLKNLTTPRFLGSYHLKQEIDPKYDAFNKILKGDLEIKYAKALRTAMFNPITIILIIAALIFNILWFFVF